jgi:NitT/TauT family transport system substrate-binding protein
VLYLYFSKGGLLTLDPTLKPKWIEALKFDHEVLAKADLSPPLDFTAWIDDSYIKKAYVAMQVDYEAALGEVVDPVVANRDMPNEIWHARDGIKTYRTVGEFLKAAAGFTAVGVKLNSTYVYDRASGLKLFGKTAFYVQAGDGSYAAFLLKGQADEFAAREKGKVLSFEQALASVAS